MPPSPSDRAAPEFRAVELPHGAVPARSDDPISDEAHPQDPHQASTPFPANEPFFEHSELRPERRRGAPMDDRPRPEDEAAAHPDGSDIDDQEVGNIMEDRTVDIEPDLSAGPHAADEEEPARVEDEQSTATDEHASEDDSDFDYEDAETEDADDEPPADEDAVTSAELEMAPPAEDADDDVHFGVAAKALGVSRKTVERMVKRGQLERGPSGAQATVSKRGLVALLDRRRQSTVQSTQPAVVETAEPMPVQSAPAPWPFEDTPESHALIQPLLEPWIEELVSSRTRAAILESQVERLTARSAHSRARDELLLALATGNWRQRRRARRYALRQFVREYDES
jgi:hypothetical protein